MYPEQNYPMPPESQKPTYTVTDTAYAWLSLLMAALLWVSYTSIAHERTQAYQILSWVIFGLIGFGMHLLFSNGSIRKWNMGDWLCCYGTVIPIIVYNLGYLVMDHGFPDWLNICCILLSEFVGILMIFVWASFGNAIYDPGYNWFFIKTSIFPFLSDEIMPVMVVASVFGVCLVIYGADYALRAALRKKVKA